MANVAILNAMTVTATTSLLQKALMAIGGALVVATVTVLIYSQFSLPSLAPQNSPAPSATGQPPASVGNTGAAATGANGTIVSATAGAIVSSGAPDTPTLRQPDASILALPDAKLTGPVADAARHMFVINGVGTIEASITDFKHEAAPEGSMEWVMLHKWSLKDSSGATKTYPSNFGATAAYKIDRFNQQDQEYIKNWVLQNTTADKTSH
jgi:hypothetical protein